MRDLQAKLTAAGIEQPRIGWGGPVSSSFEPLRAMARACERALGIRPERVWPSVPDLSEPPTPPASSQGRVDSRLRRLPHTPRGQRRPATPSMTEWASRLIAEGYDPNEWVARRAHDYQSWPFMDYTFGPVELDQWVHKSGRLQMCEATVERCRRQYLSQAEYEAVLVAQADILVS